MDIQLSGHDQQRSRRSESKIEFHDLLLSDCVRLLCSGVCFAFGSIDAVRISILIDDLSWRIALLAERISISPIHSERTSAFVARSCISDESQVRSALTLAALAQNVIVVIREGRTFILLTAAGCRSHGESNEDDEEGLDRHVR